MQILKFFLRKFNCATVGKQINFDSIKMHGMYEKTVKIVKTVKILKIVKIVKIVKTVKIVKIVKICILI